MKMALTQRCGHLAVRQPMPTRASMRPSRVTVNAAQEMPSDDEAFWSPQETDAQLFERVVKVVKASDLKQMSEDGWTVLDVRPPREIEKVHVSNAVEVPLWVPDQSFHPMSLFKRYAVWSMCGWWLGGARAQHMIPNVNFLSDVEAQVPASSKVLVTCQKGIRSKDAVEQLARAGYEQLAWVHGGLNRSKAGEVPTADGTDIRSAGIGGVSAMLNWTRLQQENAGPLGGWRTPLAIFGALWLVNNIVLSMELRPLFEQMKNGSLF